MTRKWHPSNCPWRHLTEGGGLAGTLLKVGGSHNPTVRVRTDVSGGWRWGVGKGKRTQERHTPGDRGAETKGLIKDDQESLSRV